MFSFRPLSRGQRTDTSFPMDQAFHGSHRSPEALVLPEPGRVVRLGTKVGFLSKIAGSLRQLVFVAAGRAKRCRSQVRMPAMHRPGSRCAPAVSISGYDSRPISSRPARMIVSGWRWPTLQSPCPRWEGTVSSRADFCNLLNLSKMPRTSHGLKRYRPRRLPGSRNAKSLSSANRRHLRLS